VKPPHIILIGSVGTPAHVGDAHAAAAYAGSALFRARLEYAKQRAAKLGIPWAVITPAGVVRGEDAVARTRQQAPPAYHERAFPCWRAAARGGLSLVVESDPALFEVDRLRLEIHAPGSWLDSLARAFPEARLLAPLAGLHPKAALSWYEGQLKPPS